jgi:hypothetical protein
MKVNWSISPWCRRNMAQSNATERMRKKMILVLCCGVSPRNSIVDGWNSRY